jgi:hypothetical protein
MDATGMQHVDAAAVPAKAATKAITQGTNKGCWWATAGFTTAITEYRVERPNQNRGRKQNRHNASATHGQLEAASLAAIYRVRGQGGEWVGRELLLQRKQ